MFLMHRDKALTPKTGGVIGEDTFSKRIQTRTVKIDLAASPIIPNRFKNGWRVIEHIGEGKLLWGQKTAKLWFSSDQQNGNGINGCNLFKDIADEFVLNANVLFFLLNNTHLIPDEWQLQEKILFLGTVYGDSRGGIYILYIHRTCGITFTLRWEFGYSSVNNVFNHSSPVSVLEKMLNYYCKYEHFSFSLGISFFILLSYAQAEQIPLF